MRVAGERLAAGESIEQQKDDDSRLEWVEMLYQCIWLSSRGFGMERLGEQLNHRAGLAAGSAQACLLCPFFQKCN